MTQRESDKRQREWIKAFDEEMFSYTGQIAGFIPAMFSFILLFVMIIPIQELDAGRNPFLIGMLPITMQLSNYILFPYIYTRNDVSKKQQITYDRLRYLPISKKQYRIVRMTYLFHFVKKLTAAGLAIQCVMSLIFTHSFGIENIVYVIVLLFLIPFVMGWLQLLV